MEFLLEISNVRNLLAGACRLVYELSYEEDLLLFD